MSAIKKETIIIDVTRGDCLEANRKSGKSNTGTYFISSLNDFNNFKSYFEHEDNFVINLIKVKEYMILFETLLTKKMYEYIGKGEKFNSFCNYLLSLNSNPKVGITLRINDSRVFMRFKDNTNIIVNAFRNLLYEDISYICIEEINGVLNIYPCINLNMIDINTKNLDNGFTFDD